MYSTRERESADGRRNAETGVGVKENHYITRKPPTPPASCLHTRDSNMEPLRGWRWRREVCRIIKGSITGRTRAEFKIDAKRTGQADGLRVRCPNLFVLTDRVG
ncbi:hypothetical protein EVAR_82780_1 [Eumeta japonica]|uniref:Uncharacterized protein n=1 Tax=Eumeta variegata TaxID=151549 RepID=A0A4C1UMS1_EUMVA|nr:hypothetical protein EVAR_82780_1 [Eumeta japonica]